MAPVPGTLFLPCARQAVCQRTAPRWEEGRTRAKGAGARLRASQAPQLGGGCAPTRTWRRGSKLLQGGSVWARPAPCTQTWPSPTAPRNTNLGKTFFPTSPLSLPFSPLPTQTQTQQTGSQLSTRLAGGAQLPAGPSVHIPTITSACTRALEQQTWGGAGRNYRPAEGSAAVTKLLVGRGRESGCS